MTTPNITTCPGPCLSHGKWAEVYWVDVREAVPPLLRPVLVAFDGGGFTLAYTDRGLIWRDQETQRVLHRLITHWMEIPDAPRRFP